jgi:hypothetical protein
MENIIDRFYTAFSHLDAEKMVQCYHPDVVFKDAAFGQLKGNRAMNMWRMLCEAQKGKNFTVMYKVIHCDQEKANANWEAFYTFGPTGRKVHNKISASFIIENDLIVQHEDNFNLYSWSKQAMGLKGFFIGHTFFFRKKLQEKTNTMLDKFEKRQS